MSFAEKLKVARNNKGYSQECLAEKIGVSRQTITKWESETGFPEMRKSFQLAAELQVSLDLLFEDELQEFGWNVNANVDKTELFYKSDEAEKVNEEMVKDTVRRLYGTVVKGRMLTGIKCIDEIDEGLSRGSAYYILGAPEIGKLPLAVNIAVNFLRDKRNVMFVLKEHTSQSILRQIICTDANVSSYINHSEYTEDENERIRQSADFVKNTKLYIDDSYEESAEVVFEKCIKSKDQLDLVIIDSSRLLHTVSGVKDDLNRNKRVAKIIDDIARECRCAVIALDRLDEETEQLLKGYASPELIVEEFASKSILSGYNNMMFINRYSFYNGSDNKEDFINIIYNDGYHGKGIKSLSCRINRETGKISEIVYDPDTVIKVVANYYGLDIDRINSKERALELAKARQIVMYICHEKACSLEKISNYFSRDIATVIHAHKHIEDTIKSDSVLASEVSDIMRKL